MLLYNDDSAISVHSPEETRAFPTPKLPKRFTNKESKDYIAALIVFYLREKAEETIYWFYATEQDQPQEDPWANTRDTSIEEIDKTRSLEEEFEEDIVFSFQPKKIATIKGKILFKGRFEPRIVTPDDLYDESDEV